MLFALLELCCFDQGFANKPIYNQRCYGDMFVSPDTIASLFQTSCKPCESIIQLGSMEPHAHVMFLLTPWTQILDSQSDIMHPLFNLASNMFRRGFDVTILELRDPACRSIRPRNVPALIRASLSCEESIRPNATLYHVLQKVYQLSICSPPAENPIKEDLYEYFSTSDGPFDLLDLVPPMLRTLRDVIPRFEKQPQTIVLESNNVAGVLIAEKLGIPVVMVAPPSDVELITEKLPLWSGINQFFDTRITSLKLGLRLTKMNMIRKALDLPAYRQPSEYYERVTSVVIHPYYTLSRPLPYNTEVVRPLLADCVTCNPSYSSHDNITIIVHPLDLTYISMRSVVRSIVVAKTTFQNRADLYCHDDEDNNRIESRDCTLHKSLSQLTAVLLTDLRNSHIPEMLPSYIRKENSNTLDSLARHPFTVAVISHCDKTAHVPAAMGIQIMCVPRQKGPTQKLVYNGIDLVNYIDPNVKEISQELIRMLVEKNDVENLFVTGKESKNNSIHSKNSASDIIARVSYVSKTRNISAMSHEELRMYLGQRKKNDSWEKQHFFQRHSPLLITLALFFAAIYYVCVFTWTVKHKNQLSFWQRKRRWLAPLVWDVDPALLELADWIGRSNAPHNRWTSSPSQTNSTKEHGRNRNGTVHHEKSRKRKTVKRR